MILPPRGLGYLPDPKGYIRTSFARFAAKLGLGGELPPRSLIQKLPTVMDQGPTGSCGGHAGAVVLYPYLGWLASPKEQYRNARAIDRADPNTPLADVGCRPNQLVRAWNLFGVTPMAATVPGRYSDADERTINDEPMLGDLEVSTTNLLVGDYEIYSYNEQRKLDVRAALAAGHPVAAAIAGGSPTFQNYDGGTLTKLYAPLDHYIALTGYEQTSDGRYRFRGRNSWGASWGENGDFWIDESVLDELGDLIVGDVQKVVNIGGRYP